MKASLIRSTALCVSLLALWSGAQAQATAPAASTAATAPAASDAKRALAVRMVALQKGAPDMERTAFQLTNSAVQPLVEKWGPKLDKVPAARQEKAREQLDGELNKLASGVRKLIEPQMPKSADAVLLQAYLDRFTEEELRFLVSTFESPTFRKYQSAAPELGNVWIKDVIESTRDDVLKLANAFEEAAAKILGEKPAAGAKK